MAEFRAEVVGNRNPASRLGSKNSGIRATVNGWDKGVRVVGYVDGDGKNVFDIFETGGSNGRSPDKHIATVQET